MQQPLTEYDENGMAIHRFENNIGLRAAPLRVVRSAAPESASLRYLESRRKRALDIVIGFIGVVLLALMLPVVAVVIKIISPGPIFYRQQRIGLNGRSFNLVKFRTMDVDAENVNGAVWAKPGDPRITPIGRILRRLYIDEFPQWWNVLKGEMSVVGPRPERPELTEQILVFVPNFNKRLRAKPGITGVAQVNYKYTNTMIEARNKLRHDVVYINAASLRLDIQLILRTFRRVWALNGS